MTLVKPVKLVFEGNNLRISYDKFSLGFPEFRIGGPTMSPRQVNSIVRNLSETKILFLTNFGRFSRFAGKIWKRFSEDNRKFLYFAQANSCKA